MAGKATSIERKVKDVQREAVAQAKMWLGGEITAYRGTSDNYGVRMATIALVSAQIRVETLQGKSPLMIEMG
jgi:hypothetical protein